jgi:UDP-N-acetylmuramate dehydrogenase
MMMIEILKNISLKHYNTFGVDSTAKKFVEVNFVEQLNELFSSQDFVHENKLVLGGGSNILFVNNFDGLVIKNNIGGIKVEEEDETTVLISAGAGVIWDQLVDYCVEKNYGGIENLKLIPGTVGAAPIQNIGAYGAELADVFESLQGFYFDDLYEKKFNKADCNFGYRTSIFKTELKDRFFITKVNLKLNKAPKINTEYKALKDSLNNAGSKNPSIQDISSHVKKIRESKLPDPQVLGNAGSFFKNPEVNKIKVDELLKTYPGMVYYHISEENVKIPAGWLIDQCGLKGLRMGNAGTYEKQALVMVNYGDSTGKEIYEAAMFIKENVKNKFGIELIPEVNII